jgi:hypothetical protein
MMAIKAKKYRRTRTTVKSQNESLSEIDEEQLADSARAALKLKKRKPQMSLKMTEIQPYTPMKIKQYIMNHTEQLRVTRSQLAL